MPALFPVFEKTIDGFDPSLEVSGKAFSRHSDMIDSACKMLGIKTLWDFYDESPEEIRSHIVLELEPELAELLAKEPLKWFDPSECLVSVRSLQSHFAKESSVAACAVIEDLGALEGVLNRAMQAGTRFRLALDV